MFVETLCFENQLLFCFFDLALRIEVSLTGEAISEATHMVHEVLDILWVVVSLVRLRLWRIVVKLFMTSALTSAISGNLAA
jgi:hypothetical protein